MQPLRTAVVSAMAAMALWTGLAQAATLTMSAEQPDTNYHTENARSFAEDVKTATGGALELKVQSNSILLKRPEVKRGVQQGLVPVADVLLAAMGNDDPIFEIDNIPFLAPSMDKTRLLWQTARPLIAQRLEKSNLVLLYGSPWPMQGIYTKKPVESLDDFKGMKLRAVNASASRMATLMGAVPTTVQIAEVPQAFSTNMIDMMMTSSATGVDTSAWDYTQYFYNLQAAAPFHVAYMNKRAFNALPEAQRKGLMQAAAKAEDRGWVLARAADQKYMDTLTAKGIKVMPMPPKLAEQLKGVAKTLSDEWAKKADPQALEVLNAYRNRP